jgi:hypothetical protein
MGCAGARILAAELRLFDRDGKPADQPRCLIETLGIVLFDDLRKAPEAFIVAHGRDIARDDRGRSFRYLGIEDRHGITSRGTLPRQELTVNESIWRLPAPNPPSTTLM